MWKASGLHQRPATTQPKERRIEMELKVAYPSVAIKTKKDLIDFLSQFSDDAQISIHNLDELGDFDTMMIFAARETDDGRKIEIHIAKE